MKNKKEKGFTLVELLVVISIIGLLSTLAIVSLNSAKIKARDTVRKSDLAQIRTALELYFDDNDAYPPSPCGYDCNGYYYSHNDTWDVFEAYLVPYMKVPKDPLGGTSSPWNGGHTYAYGNVGDAVYSPQYDLTANLESTSDSDRCEVKNYMFRFGELEWCGPYSKQIYEASM